jgi:hypothetical protein
MSHTEGLPAMKLSQRPDIPALLAFPVASPGYWHNNYSTNADMVSFCFLKK